MIDLTGAHDAVSEMSDGYFYRRLRAGFAMVDTSDRVDPGDRHQLLAVPFDCLSGQARPAGGKSVPRPPRRLNAEPVTYKRRGHSATAAVIHERERERTKAAVIHERERNRIKSARCAERKRHRAGEARLRKSAELAELRERAKEAGVHDRHCKAQLRALELPHGFDLTPDLSPFQHAMFTTPKANKDHPCQFPVPKLPHTLPDTHTPMIRAGEYYLRDGGYTGGLGKPYCLGCGLAVGIVVRVYS